MVFFAFMGLFLSSVHTIYSAALTEQIIPHTNNQFGDIVLDPTSIYVPNFTAQLAPLNNKKNPIIVTVPHEQAGVLSKLKDASFEYVCGTNTWTKWMIKNKANIPAPYTAIAGGEVVLVDTNKRMLVLEEHTRKGRMSLPAGHVDPQEYARIAACRELREEVGIAVEPEQLKLIALVNRLKANGLGMSDYNHYYLAHGYDAQQHGAVRSDPKEIVRTRWVPVTQLAQGGTVDGLEVTPIVRLLAQHVAAGCTQSRHLTIPNYRRVETPSWLQNDSTDVMHVELFQQKLTKSYDKLPYVLAGVAVATIGTIACWKCYKKQNKKVSV